MQSFARVTKLPNIKGRGEVDELRRRVLPNQREQEQAKMAHQLRHSRGRGHER